MRERFLKIALIFGCWTLATLLFIPQTYFDNARSQFPLTIWQATAVNMGLFYSWAVFTPLVLWLGRRFPLERKKIIRHLAILFLLGLPIILIHMQLLDLINVLLFEEVPSYKSLTPLREMFIRVGAFDIMNYGTILAISQAVTYFRKYEEREFRLAQAQLQMLKMQLHPHFLFNTLNAISELVYEAPEIADRTITQLSDLLRFSLKSGQEQEVTLKEELEFLRRYVEIQQILMQERLTVRWAILPETFDALVPNMILQPLMENSIRHGLADRARGGRIEVESRRANGMLYLRILDDGIGLPSNEQAPSNNSVGLANTRARLEHLYGQTCRFDLSASPGGGLTVSIAIPFRERVGETDEISCLDC